MIILPSIYRPESLRRFIKCYHETGATLPVLVVLESENACTYPIDEMPKNFWCFTVPEGTRIGEIFNIAFRKFPNQDFYGVVADDVTPETYRWDLLLREACLPDKIAWGFDGGHDETLPRHPFIGGELVRKLGWLSCPGIRHWFVDNAWKDVADALGCGAYRPEIRMIHRHFTNGLAQGDRTYNDQPDHRLDQITYNMWREKELPFLGGIVL